MIGTCKLCRRIGVELVESHIIARLFYKRIRRTDPQDKNKHPTILKEQRGSRASYQVKEYMLCKPCDGRIGYWENYVGRFCGGNSSSPLPARMRSNGQTVAAGSLTETLCEVIQCAPVDFDHGIFARFAASVVWRAAQYTGNDIGRITLGRYDNEFRAYLLGTAPFPKDAALTMLVSDDAAPLDKMRANMLCFPETTDRSPSHVHTFFVFQLQFDLYVGRGIPNEMRQNCLQRRASACLVPEAAHPFSRYKLAEAHSYAMKGKSGAFKVTKESRQLIESMRPNAPGRRYGPWPTGSVGFAVQRDGSVHHFIRTPK